MTVLAVGTPAPDFTLPADDGSTVTLSSLRGTPVVLYFYPKDDTPGCTQESCDFRDNFARITERGAAVFGISKDGLASHLRFRTKFSLPFSLLSDAEGHVCEAYGAWVQKSMYGKTYMGIDRSTFLIAADGKIAAVWRKVKVGGHVDEVLKALQAL